MQYRPRLWLLFLLLAAVPSAVAATQPCPWLNAATAAGAIEGPVSVSVAYLDQDNSDATCEFTHKDNHMVRTLRIEVDTMKDTSHEFPQYLAKCGPNAQALKAIGNEAIVCSVSNKNRQNVEQVVSRVRNRVFLIDVLSTGPASEREADRERARKIAELVAGFLF